MKKSYTPNMTNERIASKDAQRGMGVDNSDPFDTFPTSDDPKPKKPWLVKTPTNKSESVMSEATKILELFNKGYSSLLGSVEDVVPGEEMSKPLPKKKKQDGESEFQHKIRQWTEEVKDRPERFPGGQEQAVAIAAQQAGVAKKAKDPISERPAETIQMPPSVRKALSSRSLSIPRGVIQRDMYRSATTPISRRYSGLLGPEGRAPLVKDTLELLSEKDKKVTEYVQSPEGFIYRKDAVVTPCGINKAAVCRDCGTDMQKAKGGTLMCPTCE